MNLVTMNQQQTMSSREIASLTEKRHDNILADIRKLLEELNLITTDFSGVYKADNGQEYECFNLPKRECLILVSGYSIALRAKIIDRWQELESQQKPQLPQTFAEALQLAADQAKAIEKQQLTITNLTTVVDILNDWSSIIRVAKHNKVHEKTFKWQTLKAKSLALGYEIKRVPSARYNYQNLYHLNAFKACYPEFDYNLNKDIL